MAKKVSGITIEIDGETSGLEKALSGVNKKAYEIQKELKEVEKGLKFDPKNTELLAQKQKLLTDAIGNTGEKLKALKANQADVEQQMKDGKIGEEVYRDFQREVIKTESQLKSLEDQLKNVNNKWNDSAKALGNFGKKTEDLGNKLTPVSKVAAGALTGLVGIAVGAGAAADDINTLSKQTGLSVEEIQKFQMASDTIDVSMDTLTGSLSKLTKNMAGAKDGTGPAAEGFAQLGVSVLDSQGNLRDNEDVFFESIDALGKMTNETERDALAMSLFGKSAQDLNPLILGGADALREMGDAADAKGMILSQEEIDKANEMQDTLDSIKAESMQGLMKMGAELGPVLIPVFEAIGGAIKGVIDWFSGLDEGTMATILVILGVVAAVAPVLIVIGKVATGISGLMTLVGALGPVFALLTGPVGLVVLAIAAVIAIVVLVIKHWDSLKQMASNLGASLKTIFANIKTAVVNAFSGVLNGVKTIWTNITGFLASLPAKMMGFGKNIIDGLINGIKAKISAVTNAVKNIANAITSKIKGILGINSPSRVMMEMGEYTGEGFAMGIDSMAKNARDAAANMASGVQVATTPQGTASTMTMGGAMNMNINITGEGASNLNNDSNFLNKVKTAILTEIIQGNRSIPNRTGLIPIG